MKHAKYLEFHFWAHGRSSPAPDHTNAPTGPMPLLDQKTGCQRHAEKHTLPETNISPENRASRKERILFQPSIFRGELAVSFRGKHTFSRDVPKPHPFEPLPSGLLHRYHIGWMEAKYHYLQCPEEASNNVMTGAMELITALLDKQLALWTPWDTMGVILTFAPKMDMYVTIMSPCPFSTTICMHFIFSFKSPEGHAKSLVWEFQHSKAWPLCQFHFGETFLQCHFQQAFVTPNPSDTSKNWSEGVIVRKWFPKSIRCIKKPTENRSSLDQKITVGNWGFAASATKTEFFVFGFPTSAKLRAAKFWGTSWAFAGTVKGMLQSALGYDNQDKVADLI